MYYGLLDFQFWLLLLSFFLIVFVSFYIPGRILLTKLRIKNGFLGTILATPIGITLWGFQALIFGYLNIRFLTYLYIAVSVIYFLVNFTSFKKEAVSVLELLNKNKAISLIIVLGSIAQLVAIFPSGLMYYDGIKFFGNNSADGVMHIAYIRSIVSYFPPQEPGFSGHIIRNYHYWGDMVMADLVRIFRLPIINLFFQYFPLLLSVLTGVIAYLLARVWGGSKKMAFFFVFLLYFASDAAYVILFILHKPLGFYTPAIDSGALQFLNMPHVFGKLIFLTSLITFHKWVTDKKFRWGLLTVLLFSSLFGFKVYFGIFVGIGLFCYLFFILLKKLFNKRKKSDVLNELFLFGLFLLLSGVIFLPHNYGAGGFIYVYLEWPRSLLGAGSIDWQGWWLRRQVYEAHHNIRNLVILDTLAVVIALISIYGTRVLGFFTTKGLLKFLGLEKILFLIPALIVFHILGLFTIQASGGVNVFNFFSVSSIILSLFSAYLLSKMNSKIGLFFVILFLLLTFPRTFYEIYNGVDKIYSNDFRVVDNDEINALSYIKKVSTNNVLVQASPNNSMDLSTPYVSFFTGRRSYLSGEGLLVTHNIDVAERKNKLNEIFNSTEIVDFTSKLSQSGVRYVYLQKNPEQTLKFKIDAAYLKKVYENKSVIVYYIK